MLVRTTKGKWTACLLACAFLLGGCASAQLDDNARKEPESTEAATSNIDSQQPSTLVENENGDAVKGGETAMAPNEARATLNGKDFTVELANNETASSFAKLLPLDTEMSELNGNEKYMYLDESLPSNPINPGAIEVGDVMLYGNNCLVIFYEAHPTTYAYTRIGKIANTSELAETFGEGSITAFFTTE